jgi:hypothetical protein
MYKALKEKHGKKSDEPLKDRKDLFHIDGKIV